MDVEIGKFKDIPVISLYGEIGIYNINAIKKDIKNTMEKNTIFAIMDLKNVDYMDSSALALLINLRKQLTELGGGVKLVDVPKNILNLLEMTGILPYFDIHNDVADAAECFAGG